MNAKHQVLLAEEQYATELAFLAAYDQGPKPPGWLLTPAPSSLSSAAKPDSD